MIEFLLFILILAILDHLFLHKNYRKDSELPTHQNYEDKPLSEEASLDFFRYTKSYYLSSPQWQEKRQNILKKQPYCTACGSFSNLQIHHLSGYNRIPHELPTDLVVLCNSCHQKWHDKYGYPQSYDDYINWAHPISSVYSLKD